MAPKIYEPPRIRRIATRRRSHLPFDAGKCLPGSTYAAYTWDHESQDWEPFAVGVSRMGLRTVIRELETDGWSELSDLIERESPAPPAPPE
jgi:hypothetical protein